MTILLGLSRTRSSVFVCVAYAAKQARGMSFFILQRSVILQMLFCEGKEFISEEGELVTQAVDGNGSSAGLVFISCSLTGDAGQVLCSHFIMENDNYAPVEVCSPHSLSLFLLSYCLSSQECRIKFSLILILTGSCVRPVDMQTTFNHIISKKLATLC